MLSAPVTIPAMIAAVLPAGFDPTDPGNRTDPRTRSYRPASCVRRINGTRPAHDTNDGSSNTARTIETGCSNLTVRVSLTQADGELRNSYPSSSKATLIPHSSLPAHPDT